MKAFLEKNGIKEGDYCVLDYESCIPLNNKHTVAQCGLRYDLKILIIPIPQLPFFSIQFVDSFLSCLFFKENNEIKEDMKNIKEENNKQKEKLRKMEEENNELKNDLKNIKEENNKQKEKLKKMEEENNEQKNCLNIIKTENNKLKSDIEIKLNFPLKITFSLQKCM
jgi:flagellar biosynthesis component FlhA